MLIPRQDPLLIGSIHDARMNELLESYRSGYLNTCPVSKAVVTFRLLIVGLIEYVESVLQLIRSNLT